MKNRIVSLIFIPIAFLSYELLMAALYIFVIPMLPKSLTRDAGFCDTFNCLVLLFIYGFWYLVLYKRRQKETGGIEAAVRLDKNWKTIGSIVVIALGMSGVSNLWLLLVDTYLKKIPLIGKSYDIMQTAFSDMESGNMVFALLSVALVGPIVEELLFRGILYKYMERLSKNCLVPIIGTAVLFGVWHGILVQGVYTAMCGLVMAVVYYQTRSLAWTMTIHVINNSLSMMSSIQKLESVGYYINILSFILIVPMIVILSSKITMNPRYNTE